MLEVFQFFEERGRTLSVLVLLLLLGWESFSPYFLFFRRRVRDRLRHGLRNLLMGLVNAGVVSLVFVSLWLWTADWTHARGWGLINWLGLDGWVRVVAAVLLLDCWTYWWHRFNHELPLLWRFHRVHHSDPNMDVTTASRFHLGEIVLSAILRVPVLVLTGAELGHLALYEVLMYPVVQFHHANIGVGERWDRFLRIFLVTPAMHKVHHSRYQPETDSNYTSMLSIWDRLFGTFRIRRDLSSIRFGLDGYDHEKDQTIPGMLKTPARPHGSQEGIRKDA